MLENHATIKLAEYTIPLIGIKPYYTIEECQCCHNEYHFQELKLNESGNQFLCVRCREENFNGRVIPKVGTLS